MIQLFPAKKENIKFIKSLYKSAFPAAERKPFSRIQTGVAQGYMELLVIADREEPVGLAITAREGNLVLVDYFAMAERCRGRGYGTAALSALIDRYAGCTLFLEIEATDDGAATNQAQRLGRKSFYLRAGFLDTGEGIRLFGVNMELLSFPNAVRFSDCLPLYRRIYGRLYRRYLQQREREWPGPQ